MPRSVRAFRAEALSVCDIARMNSVAAGKPPPKWRRKAWQIAGLAIASLLALSYAGEKFHRYVAGIPDDTVISRTTAKPGMLLERRGYDFTIPGDDWYYRFDQSGGDQTLELRRPLGDELDGGFLYEIAISESVVEEGPFMEPPAVRFAENRDKAPGRASDPAIGETRLESGVLGEVLVTEGTDQGGRTFVNRNWVDRVVGVPCYAQHVWSSAEWMGKTVLTENYRCTFSHPDSEGRYVLSVFYSETGAPSRQPKGEDFIDRVESALANMSLRELDPTEYAGE